MNVHVSYELRERYFQYEFIGIPFEKNGKRYIRAKLKDNTAWYSGTFFYCFNDNWFWFGDSVNQL